MTWYTGDPLYDTLLIIGFAYAALVLVGSFFGTAAYGGRFGGGKRAKGLKLGAKQGWVLMELPGLVVFPWCSLWAATPIRQYRSSSLRSG